MWPPDIWLRGGHWPWQPTILFWSLSYLGQVLHCTSTPVLQFFDNSSLHRTKPHCLPSRQVITCCFLAFWKYSFKTCWRCQSWSCWCDWCQWWCSCCCYCCYCHNTDGRWKEPVDHCLDVESGCYCYDTHGITLLPSQTDLSPLYWDLCIDRQFPESTEI